MTARTSMGSELPATNGSADAASLGGAEGAFPRHVLAILAVLMVTLVVVTVLGNALVIYAFKVDRSLRRQSNYFLLNLAVSDFLVAFLSVCRVARTPGAFCIPFYIPYVLTGRWMLGRGLCKLWLVMDYLLCTASVFNIVLISYDRFLSVTRAVAYRARQGAANPAILKMAAVWVLAFLLYGPAIIFWEWAVGKSRVPRGECFAEFYYTWYFLLSASTLEFFSPFVSVAFFNLSIYLNIRRRNRCWADQARGPKSPLPGGGAPIAEKGTVSAETRLNLRLSRDKKIAKSLAVIVCVFGVCWAPYTLLMIIRAACSGRCVERHWYEVTFWLLWLNSAINPFLYPLCHSSFRRAFAKILCPQRGAPQHLGEHHCCQ
ncbi:hypothetical protein Z043_104453 [Scleropages formosus]|uniref:Histamine H3 receptor n=1 Tax=Scleropages formosus TaxID=113540 RepID=A0A0P7V0W1_SCLFO|nr:hypothetical protein Z043_104453 [Scleropages formosus]